MTPPQAVDADLLALAEFARTVEPQGARLPFQPHGRPRTRAVGRGRVRGSTPKKPDANRTSVRDLLFSFLLGLLWTLNSPQRETAEAGEGVDRGIGVGAAIQLLQSNSWPDQKLAFEVLTALGTEAIGATTTLIDVAGSSDSDVVRGRALCTLAEVGAHDERVFELTRSRLAGDNFREQFAACYVAARFPDFANRLRARLQALADAQTDDPSSRRAAALAALVRGDALANTMSASIESALVDRDVSIRRLAARAYAKSTARSAVWRQRLMPLLADDDQPVRVDAATAWIRRGGESRTGERVLLRALEAAEERGRIDVMWNLRLLPRGSVPGLVDALRARLRFGSVAEAVASAMALARVDSEVARAEKILMDALAWRRDDEQVVAEIESSLSLLGPPSERVAVELRTRLPSESSWIAAGAAASLHRLHLEDAAVDEALARSIRGSTDSNLLRSLRRWVRGTAPFGVGAVSALRGVAASADDAFLRRCARELLARSSDDN